SPGLHWGVGVALPVEHIRGVLERPCGRPYDERVGEYFWREHRLPTLYPSWSLVDHEDGPTLVDHGAARTRPRGTRRVGLGPVSGRVVSVWVGSLCGRGCTDSCGRPCVRMVRPRMPDAGCAGWVSSGS